MASESTSASLLHGVEPVTFNIGVGRDMRVFVTLDFEYAGLSYSPKTSEYVASYQIKNFAVPAPSTIYFSPKQIMNILNNEDEIKLNVQRVVCGKDVDYKLDIGGGVVFSASSTYYTFQFRRFWRPRGSGELYPSKNGVVMKEQELQAFFNVLPIVGRNIRKSEGWEDLSQMCERMMREFEKNEKDEIERAKKVASASVGLGVKSDQGKTAGPKKQKESRPPLKLDVPVDLSSKEKLPLLVANAPPTPSCDDANKKPLLGVHSSQGEVSDPEKMKGHEKTEAEDEGSLALPSMRRRRRVIVSDEEEEEGEGSKITAIDGQKAAIKEDGKKRKMCDDSEGGASASVVVLSDDEHMPDSQYPDV